MKLAKSKEALTEDALNLEKQCMSSQQDRIDHYTRWRNFLYTGSADAGRPAILNKMGPHVDRLSSFLFSPSETRFNIDFGATGSQDWQNREYKIGRHLSDTFHASDADLCFAEGVYWALCYGSAFQKTLWNVGHDEDGEETGGILDPHLVMPFQLGVYREDINGLERQEAICNVNYITREDLRRRLAGRSDAESIIDRVSKFNIERSKDDIDSIVHQVILGGINPVGQGSPTGATARVPVFGFMGSPQLAADTIQNLVRFVELWVKDDDTQDYTTLQLVEPDILIEGHERKRNIFIAGHHPFNLIQPNEQRGYFWGRSEMADLQKTQEVLAKRIDDVDHIWRLRARPPRGMIGFSALTDEARAAFSRPDGLIMNENPNAKIENLAPELPQDAFTQIESVIKWFDDTAGFPAIMQGVGEPGVRSGMQTDNLSRVASARLRDRALKVERQRADIGSLILQIQREKDPTRFFDGQRAPDNSGWTLDQMPDNVKVSVDSHSSSPAFTNDHRALAFALAKAQAITPKGLLMLVNPPMIDMLMQQLDQKEQAELKMMKEDPEMFAKLHGGGRRKR